VIIGKVNRPGFIVLVDIDSDPSVCPNALKARVEFVISESILDTNANVNRHEALVVKSQARLKTAQSGPAFVLHAIFEWGDIDLLRCGSRAQEQHQDA